MPLSDINCKNAKPREKPYKLADEKGLFLLVHSNGSKYFRMKYRIGGKEKLLALGYIPKSRSKKPGTSATKRGNKSPGASTPTRPAKKSKQPNRLRRKIKNASMPAYPF
jgi:hypothetical protein